MGSVASVASLLLCASLTGVAIAAQSPSDASHAALQLDLPAQPVGDALSRLAEVAGLQIVFYSDAARGIRAPELVGSFNVATALERLLADTPLDYELLKPNIVVIR